MSEEVSLERLERCLESLARIVINFGADYYPLFDRVEKEIELLKKKETTRDRAMALLNKNN